MAGHAEGSEKKNIKSLSRRPDIGLKNRQIVKKETCSVQTHSAYEAKLSAKLEHTKLKFIGQYLALPLALISAGFFLFSSANTTVNSLPRRICPSIWYLASAASAGSTYCTNPNPLGSLRQTQVMFKVRQHQFTNSSKLTSDGTVRELWLKPEKKGREGHIQGNTSDISLGCWMLTLRSEYKVDVKFFKTWISS